ncbi:hypothetical protein V9L05_08705 [Bernardetia sp. Wsw4-3y2]|uniref:hypothetical protein n=1 Tax=Bernardetia sp. Wsw4-3y2 TaxID=3127471 RepID=UPI0030CB1287
MLKTIAGIGTGLFTTVAAVYGINLYSLVNNIEFAFLGIQRIVGGSQLGNILAPKFLIATQITNPSKITVYLKAMFLTVSVETQPNKFVEIGTINQPNLNLEIQGKQNTTLGVEFGTDITLIIGLVARGAVAIYRALTSGNIPKLRFTGNVLVNKIRKKIDIIHEF